MVNEFPFLVINSSIFLTLVYIWPPVATPWEALKLLTQLFFLQTASALLNDVCLMSETFIHQYTWTFDKEYSSDIVII